MSISNKIKICLNCKKEKNLFNDFYKKKSNKDGYDTICKDCRSEKNAEIYIKNRKKKLKQANEHYKANRKQILTDKKQEYQKNPEKFKEASLQDYAKNKEHRLEVNKIYRKSKLLSIRKQRIKYGRKNQKEISEKKSKFAQTPQGKLIKQKSGLRRREQIKNTDDGSITEKLKKELLKKQNYKCNLCLTPLKLNKKGQVHLDHCVALLLDKKPEMCGIHSLCNIQYLCQRCSLRKGKKMDLVFDTSVIPASIRAKADWDYIFDNHIELNNSWELYCSGKYEVHLRETDKKKYKVPSPKWTKKSKLGNISKII